MYEIIVLISYMYVVLQQQKNLSQYNLVSHYFVLALLRQRYSFYY